MINSIKEHKSPYVTINDGIKAMSVVLAIYKSCKEHKPVDFPIKEFSTIDMINFFK